MVDKLLENINKNCHNVDIELVKKAYNFAKEAHKDQKRESGEPYIIHPIAVAEILAELGMDTNTIVAGLLHDVIEDTDCSFEDASRMFNPEVANLVDGVTKLTKLGEMEYKTKEEQQADNVRKMLLAMAKDIRVIIIKLADRLHNMRTLKFMPANKQKNKAKETLDIYAPLAHRLGMSKIKWELEDLCFRYLHEKEYYELVKDIAEKRVERESYIQDIVDDLYKKLEGAGIDSDIDGRPKHFYSIYKKMVNKNKSIEEIFDLTAIRVLVNSVKDCYGVLGIVHTIYRPIPGRFKDYIAMPKPNMYQSLHTTVIGPQGKTFEIQIRTFEMHKTAEYGIAAHWKYKEGDTAGGTEVDKQKEFEKKLAWLRDMLEWQKETSDAEEFMEGFKIDLFSDEVFVFTPKGVVINLCSKATPIDFAYRIHTDVGNKCVGAKVNGKIVPLDYTLKTGEIVEILTSPNAKGPNMDWLNIAKSNQSKSKIKLWFKKAKKEENIVKGKELFEKELKKQGVNYADIAKGDAYEKFAKRYNIHSMDDLYALIGIGSLAASSYIARLKEDNGLDKYAKERENKEILSKVIEEQIAKTAKQPEPNSYGITVKGESNLMVRFAKCCSPVPGDDILGYITKGRGVSVHRRDCSNLQNLIETDGEKVVEVNWGKSLNTSYFAEIQVQAEDRENLLADTMSVISDLKLQLSAVNANLGKEGFAFINIKIKITSVDNLNDLMKRIKRLKGVLDVYRVNS
ncbi:MAG: bifunctional (p)ppGpp synthetase/guanosine-3',5'-bis(diphosphate) 3'-pyrophosphohydrolase [Clostridium butyricum]|uniref:RelA/SpoT family protein n=1 Tax=Clostridium butyricum TaxID=1492 RepID=UPI000F543532|nr:bifunctional (p)ppGpp synthetase/guanosine-3',5'-bis(diphosphate) 3'-pyrophosphohydrolase [Clostridium butyricum]MDU5721985.1 bifunctional (p)ppGpp synthetase/guanosine-3',5'-bis(diphosphate) 3'-pyrophosphohydrolase [Clostridium butyricum]MDU5819998.1 bifunctional (p)ppGpp synthetase/guanosine-3',5'-bis(diphosphate) 3'-pyrophosphohydrolase [Clostridium butyricum]RQN09560.1 bifunctional (p)ppGpp synthetase/guanosine-3',5'-bis(diphosphate) 3'-pyrophosphohydrolase [Clostridium butyricum]